MKLMKKPKKSQKNAKMAQKFPKMPFLVTLLSMVVTWRAKSAKTIRQKMVSVMTSASCLTAFSRAFMIVFKPAKRERENFFIMAAFVIFPKLSLLLQKNSNSLPCF